MKRQTFLVLALVLILLVTSFASCKGNNKTQTTDTGTTAADTTTTAVVTTVADTTTVDTTTAEPEKTPYEKLASVLKPLLEATALDVSLSHQYNYSVSGTAYQVNQSGNIKSTVQNDKPIASAVWNIQTNGKNESANVYMDDQYIYVNQNNQKVKKAIAGDVWNLAFELEEASFTDLASATEDGVITVTGKCTAEAIAPLVDALKIASNLDFSEVSEVTFTATSDRSGAIYKFEYAFTAEAQVSPVLPSVTITHSGSATFNSFVSVTITPPSDLNSYVLG